MLAAIAGGSGIGAILISGTGCITTTNSGGKVKGASMGSTYNQARVTFNASQSSSIYSGSFLRPLSRECKFCIRF